MKLRKRILLIILVAIGVIVSVFGALITGVIVIPKNTILVITPSNPILKAGESILLTATLTSDSFILSGKTILWSASEGTLDRNVGESVLFTAPNVSENRTIIITATFQGEREYLGSSATIKLIVIPRENISAKLPTKLSVFPTSFELSSGGSINLSASLTPLTAPSYMITWKIEGPGTLSSSSGPYVTYMAPNVTEEITIKIIAIFPGINEFLPSNTSITGRVLPVGVVKKATTMKISPSIFLLRPGEEISLSASLRDEEGNMLLEKTITWELEGPGEISSSTGNSIIYRSPEKVPGGSIIVKIKAMFAGDKDYQSSMAISSGMIFKVTDEYTLTFDKALLRNVKFEGPLTIGQRKVVKISA
ncbi:MAG: hypothetical protein QXW86_13335, partial [Saccharolobus sp.]|uniref:hypothetical protein n=1 Tax=Saccharolobus sp. TaxID=2100761 RepID=UPI0031781BB8